MFLESWHLNFKCCHSYQWQDSKNPFTQNSRNQNNFFKKIVGSKFFLLLSVGKIWAYVDRFYCPNSHLKCQLACSGPNHTSKRPMRAIFKTKMILGLINWSEKSGSSIWDAARWCELKRSESVKKNPKNVKNLNKKFEIPAWKFG